MSPTPGRLLLSALNDIAVREDLSSQNAFAMLLADMRRLGDELGLDVPQAVNESYVIYLDLRKEPAPRDDHDAIESVLKRGFIVLTHNSSNESDSRYEAWAYEGSLNFDEASPLRFGLGGNPIESLQALSYHLSHPSDGKPN